MRTATISRAMTVLLLVASLLLAGCASKSNNAQTYATGGTLAGALVGALTAKNKLTGALIGAGAGMLLGYVVGNELDKQDQDEIYKTLETAPSGKTHAWHNPDTGNRFRATPAPAYVENDRIYRDIELQSEIDGRDETVHAKAYRDEHGNWHLVQ